MKFFLSTLVVLLFAAICYAQDPAKQIAAATTDLEKQLLKASISTELKQQCANDIAEARANLKRDFVLLSLYNLRTCQLELASRAFAAARTNIKTNNEFEQQWQQLNAQLAEREKLLFQPTRKPVPAILTALTQLSQIEIREFQQTSRQAVANNNIAEGLYLLGHVPANLDFATFARSLHLPAPKTAATFRSLAPELTKLEAAALRTFKSADKNSQPQFERLKASLKSANELNSASLYEGALLKYLESELYFGLIITSAEKEDLEHLQGRADEAERPPPTGKVDHSIAALFAQMAQASLKPAAGGMPTQAQIKQAVVILNLVLPSYYEYRKVSTVTR
ncbi:MAG TPA: hypothetical protein VI306_00780 [Pyrinomonadaceae bacterium]